MTRFCKPTWVLGMACACAVMTMAGCGDQRSLPDGFSEACDSGDVPCAAGYVCTDKGPGSDGWRCQIPCPTDTECPTSGDYRFECVLGYCRPAEDDLPR